MSNNVEVPSIAKTIADIKERLKTFGWIQGIEATSYGHCLVGAARYLQNGTEDRSHEIEDTLNYLHSALCNKKEPIEFWNDRYGRTVAEVFAALDKAMEEFLMMPKDVQDQWKDKRYHPVIATYINVAALKKINLNLDSKE